jgi:hypothetical protein
LEDINKKIQCIFNENSINTFYGAWKMNG